MEKVQATSQFFVNCIKVYIYNSLKDFNKFYVSDLRCHYKDQSSLGVYFKNKNKQNMEKMDVVDSIGLLLPILPPAFPDEKEQELYTTTNTTVRTNTNIILIISLIS